MTRYALLLPAVEEEEEEEEGEPSSDDFDERAETVEARPKETLTRDLKVRTLGVK